MIINNIIKIIIQSLTMTTTEDTTKPHLLLVKNEKDQLLYERNATLNLRCIADDPTDPNPPL